MSNKNTVTKKPHHYHFTLVFIPEDNGKTFSLRIHKMIIYSLLVFTGIFCCGLVLLIYKSGEIAAKLQLVYFLRAENKKLTDENKELRIVSQKIMRLESLASYLERLSKPDEIAVSPEKEKPQTDVAKSKLLIDSQNTMLRNPDPSLMDTSGKPSVASVPNIAPVEGWITRGFSSDSNDVPGHMGLDYAASAGVPIKATAPGIVENIQNDQYFGLIVTMKHENGFKTRYGHCSQVLVALNERVKKGQTIALVGNTGRSSAPHLHYEVIKDGKNDDPKNYFIGH
jgi:murein DD-endopeptidase MepM/ murein hydrolase activator NlpD